MRSATKLAVAAALSLAGAASADPRVGAAYELTQSYETSGKGGNGSRSSSNGHDTIVERVIAVDAAGVELEYNLPRSATAADRARTWEFPARVRRSGDGNLQLLNGADLEARLARWLIAAKVDRSACGKWIFTWNAFRIECDPQSVLATIAAYDVGLVRPVEGMAYRDPLAIALGLLKRTTAGSYTMTADIDPNVIRNERVDADLVVGELTRQPIGRDAAVQKRGAETVSGTITVTFDTGADDVAWRRTRVVRLETKSADGTETSTRTETLTRRTIDDAKP